LNKLETNIIIKFKEMVKMWKIILIAIIFLFINTIPCYSYNFWQGEFDDWNSENTNLMFIDLAFTIIDIQQTNIAINHGGREINPLIGEYPSESELIKKFIAWIIVKNGIAYILQKDYRFKWQIFNIGLSFYCIGGSYGTKLMFNI
jgi:hypothetical protein